MQQWWRLLRETQVLLASTFTGMLHSVGERVQGKQPETQFVFAEKQKDKSLQEMEESGRRMIEVEK